MDMESAADTNKSEAAANKTLATGGAGEPRKVVQRRRKKKSKDGPKHPLTGYIRYMNVRREELRALQPDATTIEITKLIGAEWNHLADEVKQPYLAAAKIDFERYNQECIDYKKTLAERVAADSDTEFVPSKKSKDTKTMSAASMAPKTEQHVRNSPATVVPAPLKPPANANNIAAAMVAAGQRSPPTLVTAALKLEQQRTGNYDIPIFTEEFLEHNKLVDFELRMLRKSNTDYEQQNSVLERHVESMAEGVAKLRTDAAELEHANGALQTYLDGLLARLVAVFEGVPSAGHADGATTENVDAYMGELAEMAAMSQAHGPPVGALNRARDVLRKLEV